MPTSSHNSLPLALPLLRGALAIEETMPRAIPPLSTGLGRKKSREAGPVFPSDLVAEKGFLPLYESFTVHGYCLQMDLYQCRYAAN